MSTTTLNKNAVEILSSVENAAGANKYAAIDLRTDQGGIVTVEFANSSSAPTAPCLCRVLIAHTDGATPTAGAAGAVWKQIWVMAGGLVVNEVVTTSFEVSASVQHLCLHFSGNTAQAVTVKANMSKVSSATSV